MAETDDFVGIIGGLANYIQNERVAAYNEAVDMMLNNVRQWSRQRLPGCTLEGNDLPSLLDEITSKLNDAIEYYESAISLRAPGRPPYESTDEQRLNGET